MRDLRPLSKRLLASGRSVEEVARRVVKLRNKIKRKFRVGLDKDILEAIEARNLMKYGDPLGPTAEDQFRRYGSWLAVIDAACRPSKLS